jgi:hypothetical protein
VTWICAGERVVPLVAAQSCVSPAPAGGAGPTGTDRHEYGLGTNGRRQIRAAMLPFITDGLVRDQPVMVAVPGPWLHALRDPSGPDAAPRSSSSSTRRC